jgi:MoaA/NifB/PqqE/SkfB family radical SAM enzyme
MEQALDLAAMIRPRITRESGLSAYDRMSDAIRKIKALHQMVENFAINRRRYRQGDHALRPLYVIWTMLNACNFRCSYCDNHQGEHYYDIPDQDRLDTEKGKRLLAVMRTGTPAIYWCGGEPTMRDDLPELLEYAWELGYFPNMINTNASLLHKRLMMPEWRNFLWKMDMIIVSLDGLNLERLNRLWGTRMARQVVVNLLMLVELKKDMPFKLVVNTVITPESIDEAGYVLDLMCDLGIWFVPVPVNLKHEPVRALLDDPDYVHLANTILGRKKQGHRLIGSHRLLKQLVYAENYQCLTALKPHVWSNGEICWPCRASAQVKPVNIKLLDYTSFDEAYEAGRRMINPNFFHGPAQNQCGGNCAWMQNYTTARYLDGILHPVRSGIFQEMFEFAVNKKD